MGREARRQAKELAAPPAAVGAGVASALVQAGVSWHLCGGCGRPWPFPMGIPPEVSLAMHEQREWRCHNCVQAQWALLERAKAAGPQEKPPRDIDTAWSAGKRVPATPADFMWVRVPGYCSTCGAHDLWQRDSEGEGDYYHQCTATCHTCESDHCCMGPLDEKEKTA